MGFQPPKDLPAPPGHYQTREQTALFKVMGRFLHEDNNTIIRRFWWTCPDGNCTSEQLDNEIQRLRKLGRNMERDIQKHQGVKKPVLPPVKRKKPLSKKRTSALTHSKPTTWSAFSILASCWSTKRYTG